MKLLPLLCLLVALPSLAGEATPLELKAAHCLGVNEKLAARPKKFGAATESVWPGSDALRRKSDIKLAHNIKVLSRYLAPRRERMGTAADDAEAKGVEDIVESREEIARCLALDLVESDKCLHSSALLQRTRACEGVAWLKGEWGFRN